ncbi:hypothetical protein M885DRAFT_528101 [Pelagophyceae sp. CCMP2097]|nr:hypothetical protein M885DRAFT_528101 [Pelagophyceae sp. CCMP2097]
MIEACARAEGVENTGLDEHHLVQTILRCQFGDACAAAAAEMLKCADGVSLRDIEKNVNPPKLRPAVRRAMACMIQHNMVIGMKPPATDDKKKPKPIPTYKVVTRNVTERLRHARMIDTAQKKWGNDEASVLRAMLKLGRATTQTLLRDVLYKEEREEGDEEWLADSERTGTALTRLVERGTAVPVSWFFESDKQKSDAPGAPNEAQTGKCDSFQSLLEEEDDNPQQRQSTILATKRALTAELSLLKGPESGDASRGKRRRDDSAAEIVWRPRLTQLRLAMMHEACEKLAETKLNAVAREIVTALLTLDAYRREPRPRAKFNDSGEPEDDGSGEAVSVRQLTAELQRRQRDSSKLTEYLERLQNDSVGFVKKIAAGARRTQSRQYSARSDDVFVFDFPVVINYLRKATLHAVLLERYGPEAARVHRVLAHHRYLDQADLAEKSLLQPKDARERLYKLFTDTLVEFVELAPSTKTTGANSVFLWSVDIERSYKRILDDSRFAIHNLLLRRNDEVVKNAYDETVDADPTELKHNVTDADALRLEQFKQTMDIIDHAILQLDECCMLFERTQP